MMNFAALPTLGPWPAIALLLAGGVAIQLVLSAVRAALHALVRPRSVKGRVLLRMVTGLPFGWSLLALSLFLLQWRGERATDIGWGPSGTPWGWVLALGIAVYFVSQSINGPWSRGLRFIDPAEWIGDLSAFRVLLALAIGITAGVCEETVFRGFIIRQALDGGAPIYAQVLLSGFLFGIAHIGIATFGGRFDGRVALGVIAATSVFGVLYALAFLAGGRSLLPCIVGHGLYAAGTEPFLMVWAMSRMRGS